MGRKEQGFGNVVVFSLVSSVVLLCLTSALTFWIRSGMQSIAKMNAKWKNVFYLNQFYAIIGLACAAVRYGVAMTELHEESGRNSAALITCALMFSANGFCVSSSYLSMLWFWFVRLEITFGNSKSLGLASWQKHLMIAVVVVWHLLAAMLFGYAFVIRDSRAYGGEYLCHTRDSAVSSSAILLAMIYISLSVSVTVMYGRRLKAVMTGRCDLTEISYAERQVFRKTTLIAVTSVASSLLTQVIFQLTVVVFFIWMDLFFNTVLIGCYFKFGQPIYDRLFCLCEKHSSSLDRCLGLEIRDDDQPDLDRMATATATAIEL